MRTFFTLLEGGKFHFFDPTQEGITQPAMVRGLAREGRYARQTTVPWPVACHLVGVAALLEHMGRPRLEVCAGAVHDVEEALLGDVPTPLKAILRVALPSGEVVGYEEGIGRSVRARCLSVLGLPPTLIDLCESPEVKRADRIALHAEGAVLHPKILTDLDPLPVEDHELARWMEAGVRGLLKTLKAGAEPGKLWATRLKEVRRG